MLEAHILRNTPVLKGYVRQAMRYRERLIRAIHNPKLEVKGKRYLRMLRRDSSSKLRMDQRTGWVSFDTRSFSPTNGASSSSICEMMRTLGEKWAAKEDPERHKDRGYPINMLLPSDLEEYPDILEFALREEFLLAVSKYLGQVPRLFNLGIWWSPPKHSIHGKESVSGSQQYHYDHRDNRQAKIFVNLNDIDEESGPLHFLPADSCARFNKKIGYTQGKIPDEIIYSVCAREEVVDNRGRAGTGVMVDTSRCLHYGSRDIRKDRLILMISYARPNCARPCDCTTLDPVRDKLADQLYSCDPIRRYALAVPISD